MFAVFYENLVSFKRCGEYCTGYLEAVAYFVLVLLVFASIIILIGKFAFTI